MSKLGYIYESIGKKLNLSIANTYSENVINGNNLPENSLIISSPINEKNEDTGTYSILCSDYEGTGIRLTYSIQEGNGLYYSNKTDSLSLNIDNRTIKTNSSYDLTISLDKIVDGNTISFENSYLKVNEENLSISSDSNYGVAKLDTSTISSDEGKIFVNTSNLEYSDNASGTIGIVVGDGKGIISNNGLLDINESSIEYTSHLSKGIVRSDGYTIESNEGVLSVNTQNLDKATNDNYGISKVDNKKIKINSDDKIYIDTSNINIASELLYGIAKINTSTLEIDNDTLSAKKFISVKEYIKKYYDLSEEYRNKLNKIHAKTSTLNEDLNK